MTPTSMQLPDTRNANQLYAFKKGYRAALEGKNLNHMPSAMRYDPAMRDYFQQGWEQAQERLAEQMEKSAGNPWRHRAAWWLTMIIGGLATGAVLIKNIQQDQQVQQPALSAENSQPSQPPVKESEQKPQAKNAVPKEAEAGLEKHHSSEQQERSLKEDLPSDQESTAVKETELALLTPTQRKDLTLTRQERTADASEKVQLAPVVKSDIGIKVAALTTAVSERTPKGQLGNTVPKNIRKLYFFTQVEGASNQTVYHRWIFNHRKMALIPLKINSNLYRTWSSKRLTSAWQGQWHIEVLNADKQVIYRHSFTYGH